jgi:5'-3' exonuclease
MKKNSYPGLSLKTDSEDNSVLVVDGTNLFIRSFAAYPTVNDQNVHIGGFFGFLDTLVTNVKLFNVSRVVVCFDGDNSSSRRKKKFPEYKANRSASTKLNRFIPQNAEEEAKLIEKQMELLQYYLSEFPVHMLQVSGAEADDVIAYICLKYFDKETKKIILSSDKDFLQLVRGDIYVVSTVKQNGKYPLYTPKKVVEKYGVHPNNFLLMRCFEGDTSDNIPGVSGIGLKTLIKQTPSITSKDKIMFDDLLQEANIKLESKPKSKQLKSIVESKEIIERNYDLMQLSDSYIPFGSLDTIYNVLDESLQKPDFYKIRTMAKKHGLALCIHKARRCDFITFIKPIFSRLKY